MPVQQRCEFCSAIPKAEVAILRWVDDDRERLTLLLCAKHLGRIQKTGKRGWEHGGKLHKEGWW
jgi:hypothetical protein